MTATRQQFFKPTKASAAKKAEDTNSIAKGIIAQEAADRDKKTERLRAQRLARETMEPAPTPAPVRKRKQG
ncbi:hypothetical protein KYK29_01835 [Shinella daejeonensis]|uniref:hypothetical protein n=1 Tax=Shinella daejeonensis TaxID=659017 RepID=UPI0020C79A3F|nr:hypothetical protein [Shinella daejeonensis]MCP8893653.1 hypothetical protein [Shinella daejeonensis]